MQKYNLAGLNRFRPYVVAVGAVCAAAGWQAAILGPWTGDGSFFGVSLLAIILTAWLGGLMPGLAATALSLTAKVFFFIPPQAAPLQVSGELVLLLINGCVISLLCGSIYFRGRAPGQIPDSLDNGELPGDSTSSGSGAAAPTAALTDEHLAMVSHEMRAPLTAVLGWVQLLRQGHLPEEKIPQALETIERNVHTLTGLIEDLLDLSRIFSGHANLEIRKIRPVEAIEAAMTAVEPKAAVKNVHLIRRFGAHADFIYCDTVRIQQILLHLLDNAIKFAPPDGKVTVATREADSQLEISVSDDGEGIVLEFLPHVFDQFRQQDASAARKHSGLGVGLSVVKKLVEMHGGKVRAESAGSGQGATFVVTLPLAAPFENGRRKPGEASPGRPPKEGSLPTLLGIKVLVVDDDSDARELFRSILAQNGASVQTASSVAEAIKEFEFRHPDVLISDIGMPGQDGYELVRTIRRHDRTRGRRTPMVALTAFAQSTDHRRTMNAGFQRHLAKPVEPSELITVVASLVKR